MCVLVTKNNIKIKITLFKFSVAMYAFGIRFVVFCVNQNYKGYEDAEHQSG